MPGRVTWVDHATVRVLTLSNPFRRNALDPALCGELASAARALAPDGVRCAVITGDTAGGAFSAGFDLEALGQGGAAAADAHMDQVIEAIASQPVPVVGALHGAALGGGCELAAACDLRVAHPATRLGLPPARLGLVYATRGLVRLSALAGESRARRLFLTAEVIDASTAHGWGLVDELADEPLQRALALAVSIASLAPLAVQGMRAAFEAVLAHRATLEGKTAKAIAASRATAAASADAKEGLAAVQGRRPPTFTGS
jgi:enoyl-CoA hydratase/carnithine racemase